MAKVQMFRWGPLKGSASHYPPGFGLEMFAVTSPGAGRYFLSGPGGDAAFLRTVSFGGLVILNRIAKLCKEQRFSYRIMGLISQMGPKLQEHFSRASGVEVEVCRHVIDTLHMRNGIRTKSSRMGEGSHCKDDEVLQFGQRKASELGFPTQRMNHDSFRRLWLLEQARLDPVDIRGLDVDGCFHFVRSCMFDLTPSEKLSEADVAKLEERFLDAISEHVQDDSDRFNHWFFERIDNIIHRVAKKRRGGGPMPRDTARQALLEMVVRSYRYGAQCIDLQMQEFTRALPTRSALNATEQARFDLVYRCQPWLGNIPLIVLHQRFGYLEEFLRELHQCPMSPAHPGILLRLLDWYGQSVSSRRMIDREQKRRSVHRNTHGRPSALVSLPGDSKRTVTTSNDRFHQVAELLRQDQRISCQCQELGQWQYHSIGESSTIASIAATCSERNFQIDFDVSIERRRELKEFLPD